MAEVTSIEWCDATFNPWWGCTKVSPACDHCYAERNARRFQPGRVLWGVDAERRTFGDDHWEAPLRWARTLPAKLGRRPRVFCASMSDVFDKEAPAGARERLWNLILWTPELDWLLLTKRIGNARAMMPPTVNPFADVYPNVWIGATVVSQEEADRDIPKLLAVPTRVRFVSLEPMLGPIDLQKACTATCPNRDCFRHSSGRRVVVDSQDGGALVECICSRLNGLHWVICGGESGPDARPMHPDWARSSRDQCAAAGVPYLFKQWGKWLPGSQAREVDNQMALVGGCGRGWKWDDGTHSWRIGRKAAGRLLDGVEHNGFPA